MRSLLDITGGVIWIDHHKTAIEKYDNSQYINDLYELSNVNIYGIREVGKSGCELTWTYFMGTIEPPNYIKYIGDRDTWTWKYGGDTKDFFAGILAEDTAPQSHVWESLASDISGEYHYLIMANGKIIDRYRSISHKEVLSDTGFWVQFHNHNCYAVNSRFDSKPFEALVPEAEIWLTFRYIGKSHCWMVSLYSDKVDVSEIAEQYEFHGKKGGGHTGAAGFECEYPPFLQNDNVKEN
jgi:oligoribonuclease NrnB/cAMP/cGMP phosphodiesterase (DHH superfamily)